MMCSKAVILLLLILLILLFLSWSGIFINVQTEVRSSFGDPFVNTFALPSFQFSFPHQSRG